MLAESAKQCAVDTPEEDVINPLAKHVVPIRGLYELMTSLGYMTIDEEP